MPAALSSAAALLRLPVWALVYLFPDLRQDKEWSYRQAWTNKLLKAGLRVYTSSHFKHPISLKPGREGKRFVLIEPAKADLYTGVALDKEIKPETIGGTWYPEPYTTASGDGQYVILHFHGGSYILGNGRSLEMRYLTDTLLSHTPASYIFSPQYRLACRRNGRFPAQLQDAISAYSYLVHTVHVSPSRIILSGDSSGAHLILALLRYIIELNNDNNNKTNGDPSTHDLPLPLPRCSWLFSPWCDIPASIDIDDWERRPNYKTEYVPGSFPAWGAREFLGVDQLKPSDVLEPYIIPLRHPFVLPCPTLVITGAKEVLLQEHEKLVKDYREVARNNGSSVAVELYVQDRVPHDVLMIAWILGFRKEARQCAIQAGEFLTRVTANSEHS